jgi:hypothetical protein
MEIEKALCEAMNLGVLARGRVKVEFLCGQCWGSCVATLMGFRLSRFRGRDTETVLEEVILNVTAFPYGCSELPELGMHQ